MIRKVTWGCPATSGGRRPPPEPVGREGTTLGAHATVADALHVVGRRLGPQLNHSNGGVPPGADQSQETTLAAVAADALDT